MNYQVRSEYAIFLHKNPHDIIHVSKRSQARPLWHPKLWTLCFSPVLLLIPLQQLMVPPLTAEMLWIEYPHFIFIMGTLRDVTRRL
jgi:hypothetical protein